MSVVISGACNHDKSNSSKQLEDQKISIDKQKAELLRLQAIKSAKQAELNIYSADIWGDYIVLEKPWISKSSDRDDIAFLWMNFFFERDEKSLKQRKEDLADVTPEWSDFANLKYFPSDGEIYQAVDNFLAGKDVLVKKLLLQDSVIAPLDTLCLQLKDSCEFEVDTLTQ